MALDRGKLYDGLLDAFAKGKESQEVSSGEEGETESKYSDADVAGFIADAIAVYAADAEIMMLPGPMLIPSVPPVPSISQAAILANQMAEPGKAAVKSAILAGFKAMDAPMAMWAPGLIAYAATFTMFTATVGHLAAGTCVMAVPPILAPCTALGMAGAEEPDIIDLMATIIHASFMATIFTGAGVGVDGGLGAVVGPLM